MTASARPRVSASTGDDLLGRLATHEKVCAERYGRIDESLIRLEKAHEALVADQKALAERVDRRFDSINKSAWGVAGALALLAASLLAYLFVHVWPPA